MAPLLYNFVQEYVGEDIMTQPSLWDFLDKGGNREEYLEACDKDEARRRAIKRVRASGHWLTLLRVARRFRSRSRSTIFRWLFGEPVRSSSG